MRFWRSMVVGFGLGSTTFGLILPGCGGGLGEVVVQELSSTKTHFPTITAERLQECFAIHGGQLPPGRYNFNPIVELNRDGVKQSVKTPDMPDTAPDFAACTRIALGDMSIPDGVLPLRRTETTATNEVTPAQRLYLGNPAVAVIVVVGLSEIVLEAGAYTVLFAVTVKVVEKAKDDVLEALKRTPITDDNDDEDCTARYDQCIDRGGGGQRGNHWHESRCGTCRAVCQKEKSWPAFVPLFGKGLVPCP
jgi:hypothetical protein